MERSPQAITSKARAVPTGRLFRVSRHGTAIRLLLAVLLLVPSLLPAQQVSAGPPAATNSVDWFDWGMDFRIRDEGLVNVPGLASAAPGSEVNYLRLSGRVWSEVRPVEEAAVRARFISEPRYFIAPDAQAGWVREEGIFDELQLRVTNILAAPLSATLGRQTLCLGDKWLVLDATPLDGTRSEYFDAARLTLQVAQAQTTVDAVYLYQDASTTSWLPVLHEVNEFIAEQDEQAGMLYVRNQSLPRTQLDAYAIFRHQSAVIARGNSGDLWMVGGRVAGRLGERWSYRLEGAPQFGRLNGANQRAWGGNSLLTYDAGGAWDAQLRVGYEYLSGDDRDSTINEGWDPLWGRRALWSELMVFQFAAEERGRPGDYKNLHRPNLGVQLQPHSQVQWSASYAPLFAPENPQAGQPGYSSDGKFRGHFLQSILRYQPTQRWGTGFWLEYFLPGDFYSADRQDAGWFYRTEVTWRF